MHETLDTHSLSLSRTLNPHELWEKSPEISLGNAAVWVSRERNEELLEAFKPLSSAFPRALLERPTSPAV